MIFDGRARSALGGTSRLRRAALAIVPRAFWATVSPVTRLALTQIRLRYVVEGRALDAATEAALKADPRAGARAILDAVARRRFANRSERQRLRKLLRYECALWATGVLRVAGVDEA